MQPDLQATCCCWPPAAHLEVLDTIRVWPAGVCRRRAAVCGGHLEALRVSGAGAGAAGRLHWVDALFMLVLTK